jgi:threonine dehydrogenase-like Zn-dependent dehydrogenase
MKAGDLVVMPFAYSDGTCAFCREGLPTSCIHGGFFGTGEMDGPRQRRLLLNQLLQWCWRTGMIRQCVLQLRNWLPKVTKPRCSLRPI